MNPSTFYAIWFTQRNGSTLLCKALESTGVLGKPAELLSINTGETLLGKHKAKNYPQLQDTIFKLGTTENGVFGVKLNAPKKENDRLINELKLFPLAKAKPGPHSNFSVWDSIFPTCKHIFLTRRNKVRQAVSWWKAIMTNEWHRKAGRSPQEQDTDLIEKYDFNAIKHLLIETSIRESKIQAFLNEGKCSALTIVYEDFIADFSGTVQRIATYLDKEVPKDSIGSPYYSKLADGISDEWTERFRLELQQDWPNKVW